MSGNDIANMRCNEGWRLFWIIGDLYQQTIKQPQADRNWHQYNLAKQEKEQHTGGCIQCQEGIKKINEMLTRQAA
jgi:hypothetical protein